MSTAAASARLEAPSSYEWDTFFAALGDVPATRDTVTVKRKSRDYFWYSPVLNEQLKAKFADVVVSPRDEADVIRAASACAKARIPLVVRGAGTGNYGQAVPLEGGVILEMAALDAIEWIKPGLVRVGAGRKRWRSTPRPAGRALSCACTPRRSAWRRSAASSPAARAASAR